MNWYVEVLRKYMVFTGRARRQEYWMFILVSFGITIALGILESMVGGVFGSQDFNFFTKIYGLFIMIPSFAVGVRRLHDTGKSGWWILMTPIPVLNIVLLVFMCLDSQPGPNNYGANPKQMY